MSAPRRSDSTQIAIVQALREAGVRVLDLHAAASAHPGLPDLLCSWWSDAGPRVAFFEIKSPTGRESRAQMEFHRWWAGRVEVVRTVKQALEACGMEVQGGS